MKVLRKIREKMVRQNKISKYLLYAIGEIILVVIGILIALQINNWNEERKAKLEELKLLKELRKDVAFSVEELDTVAYYNQKSLNYLLEIQNHLVNDLPYSKVLDTAFGRLDVWSVPYLPTTSYETLKIRGLDRIGNDSLKTSIIKLYEYYMKFLIDDNGRWEWSFNENTTQRMMIGNIRRSNGLDDFLAKPNDYNALKQNVEFGNFLNVLVNLRMGHTEALKEVSREMQGLLRQLDIEIASLSDD